MRPAFGDWRSLVAHFVRDEGVGGSNPLSPTKFRKTQPQGWVFCFLRSKEDENLRGWRFDPSAARERCAATARRASHAVASHPLAPTKFRKTQPYGWVFCFLRPQVLHPHNCLMAASPYQAYAIQQIFGPGSSVPVGRISVYAPSGKPSMPQPIHPAKTKTR